MPFGVCVLARTSLVPAWQSCWMGAPLARPYTSNNCSLWLAIESTTEYTAAGSEMLRRVSSKEPHSNIYQQISHAIYTLHVGTISNKPHEPCQLFSDSGSYRPWSREVRCMDLNRHVPLRSAKSIVVEGSSSLPPIFLIYCHLIFYLASTGAVRIWKSARVCVH